MRLMDTMPEAVREIDRLVAIRESLKRLADCLSSESPDCDTVEKVRALRSRTLGEIEAILLPEWRPG